MGGEMKQSNMLLQVAYLLKLKNVWQESKPWEILKSLLYVHVKGWLYCQFDKDGILDIAIIAYRIKEYTDTCINEFPEKEEGTILFVPLFVSVSDDKKQALRMAKDYLGKNKDITEIVFKERGEKVKHFKRRSNDGKEETRVTDTSADLSERPADIVRHR